MTHEEITIEFEKLKTTSQLATLLNKVEKNRALQTEKLQKLKAKDLNFLAISKDSRYREFKIFKKSGKERIIDAPDNYLKRVQTLINDLLQIIFEPKVHNATNGFLLNRDIVRNARVHVNKRYLLNLDIEDFFPTISFRRVKSVLELAPFNLNTEKENLAFIIANICSLKGKLPQGAPTSPILSNIVTQQLDRRITKYCLKKNVKYSRYADDLSFSSNLDVFDKAFIKGLTIIVKKEGFKINKEKTRMNSNMERQQVTGIIVNEKLNVKRDYIQKVRAMLNNWEKGGLDYAKAQFIKHYGKSKYKPDFRKALKGHINFIGLVRGKEDPLFSRLLLKYNYLNYQIDCNYISNKVVQEVLERDNKEMESIPLRSVRINEDNFIAFCTSAFHQIENLLNYFYWRKFPEIEDLLQYIMDYNEAFHWKSIEKCKKRFPKISKIQIWAKVYIFEKEFYFDKKIPYNKDITILREIRNDDSHRCAVISYNRDGIKMDYKELKIKCMQYKEEHKKNMEKSSGENILEQKYKVIKFLEERNYNSVRRILKGVSDNIKNYPFVKPVELEESN
ncbi:MAG: RNA-directed DNA polymerase [Bacteroidales bacterium]|nr:RNA-directed DNA polymerase [Bacteroidales bacterium]